MARVHVKGSEGRTACGVKVDGTIDADEPREFSRMLEGKNARYACRACEKAMRRRKLR